MPISASRPVPADIVASARRVEERSALRLVAQLHAESGERSTAIVTDVTTRGCRLETAAGLAVDSHVTLILRSTLIGGWVAWCEDGAAGIEFGARLLPKMLASAIAAAPQA